jgi:hypothetical protein
MSKSKAKRGNRLIVVGHLEKVELRSQSEEGISEK